MENANLDKIIKADELDTNMILSVPEEIGLKLQKIIQGQATQQEKDSTIIEILENPSESIDPEESRKMVFKINDILLPITILDLPCIIEAQKTIDYKTFYKSGDIAQMMFVHDKEFKLDSEGEITNFNPFKAGDETFSKLVWKKDYDHKYKCKHGLGKSTKNIRAKRFKRKIRYNNEEILEVAKKLKSIIDNGAASFENQMKNKEAGIDNVENQSIIQSTSDLVGIGGATSTSNLILSLPVQSTQPVQNLQNIKLVQPEIQTSSAKKKKKAPNEFNIPLAIPTTKKSNTINFNIPVMDESSMLVDSHVSFSTSQPQLTKEEQMIHNEYEALRKEYKQLKKDIEENPSEDKIKRKKKIKKRIKEIKKNYQEAAK